MAFKKDSNISWTLKENGINEVIDEKGNTILMLREIAWGDKEPKLELRKWFINNTSNEEVAGKGVSFTTPQSAHNLVHTMTKLGFGDTSTVLNNLKNRADFDEALVKTVGKAIVNKAKETSYTVEKEDYYDPQELIS